MTDYDVIVIGAGLGGLSAGSVLAKRGRKVLVLEQSDRVGGCCSTFERDGYHFDIGASIVEAVRNIHILMKELGSSAKQELDLIPCDPVYSVLFRDGARVSYYESIDKTAEAIGAISPEDKDNFYCFAAKFAEFIDGGGEDFFTTPVNTFSDMMGLMRRRPVIAKFFPFFLASYEDVINRYFKDERIRQSMAYQSFYAGHPPDLTPGIFAVLPYYEHLGMYYPRGGMIQIPLALQRRGEQYGMEIRFNEYVKHILVDEDHRVKGVELADGTRIPSPVVVSNANCITTYLKLVGEEKLPAIVRRGVKSYEPSLTCPMVYLGVDFKPPLEAHHTIFPLQVEKMNNAWWNRFRKGMLPTDQFGLICWPSHSDTSLAPEGHHVINIILNGPYDLQGTNWDNEKPRFIEQTIEFMDRFAIPGLAQHVQVADMSTPLDYERRLLLPKGAIYGIQQDLTAQAVFRPAIKSKSIKGLYLAGASTHPGGGVPTTMGSGLMAANLITGKH
jgi:phytoene desaturase